MNPYLNEETPGSQRGQETILCKRCLDWARRGGSLGRIGRAAFLLLFALAAPLAFAGNTGGFALVVRPGGQDKELPKDASAYVRVLDSVELPFAQVPVDQLPQQISPFTRIIVPRSSAQLLDADAIAHVVDATRRGALLITECDTPLARALGVDFSNEKVSVRQIEDARYPKVMTVWETAAEVPRMTPPPQANILVKEKWTAAPLVLTFAFGRGRVLFLATELDPVLGEGYARFPYFIHSLTADCGVHLPFRSPRLQTFFDYGYRSGVDLEYFARRWRKSGVMVLHASAWQFWDRNRDDYLKQLISACHKNGILVYAWLELPHVSDDFWQKHPEWREKTATLTDAKLDWRALVNLLDPAAFQSVSDGLLGLLADFDWDGVNIGELYFESPQGPSNPHRFTPLNDSVRTEFRTAQGIDPIDFFNIQSPHYWQKDAAGWEKFIAYRCRLIARLHEKLLEVIAQARLPKPWLQSTVTFVDNVYDGRMREAIATDLNTVLPLAGRYGFDLIMEDPGTIWSHGPSRYRMLGERYRELGPSARWGIDINVVDRYQDVYPTKKQTGTEFLQLFHFAGQHFPVVLAYFEQSIYAQDMQMVANALASGARIVEDRAEEGTLVDSPQPVCYSSGGPASTQVLVDQAEWPAREGDEVCLPAGRHTVRISAGKPAVFRLHKLTGNLLSAAYDGPRAFHFAYQSRPRAIAILSARPRRILVDGSPFSESVEESDGEFSAMLPAGSHDVRVEF